LGVGLRRRFPLKLEAWGIFYWRRATLWRRRKLNGVFYPVLPGKGVKGAIVTVGEQLVVELFVVPLKQGTDLVKPCWWK
jgi:hypothetical protein